MSNSNLENGDPREGRTLHLYYIAGIIGVAIILIIMRIIFDLSETFYELSLLRDVDFKTLYDLQENGLFEYYDHPSIAGFRALYLYFWYFLFYPVYLLPPEIGVYVWDGLRLLSSIYIAKNIYKITENSLDIILFFILSGLGFFADMFLNNTNWLLQLLLFESYLMFEKDKKWLAGIFFALACYKITIVVFPFILLLVREVRFKDLLYFLLPFFILCIPYLIFPEYFFKMFYNWTYVEAGEQQATNIFLKIYLMFWQTFQTAQMMFIGLFLITFTVNISNPKWQSYLRWLIFIFLILMNLSFPLILWQIT